jgi:hypothetical protein
VDPAKFGPTWDRYRNEQRTVASWQTFINTLVSGPSMSEDNVVKIGTATMRGRDLFTPHKKRKAKMEDASPTASEHSFENINYIPLWSEEDPATQWTAVAINLEWLHKMSLSAKKGRPELEDSLAEEVTNLEARIGKVRAIVGDRPSKLGTATAFSCLMEHYLVLKDIDKRLALSRDRITDVENMGSAPTSGLKAEVIADLQSTLTPILDVFRRRVETLEGSFDPVLEAVKNRVDLLEACPQVTVTGVKSAVKAELYVELTAAIAPLRELFSKLSSHLHTPGNKLNQQISNLTAGLVRVEGIVQQGNLHGFGVAPPQTLNWPAGAGGGFGLMGGAGAHGDWGNRPQSASTFCSGPITQSDNKSISHRFGAEGQTVGATV